MPVAAESVIALDTSAAIPLLVQGHDAHRAVTSWVGDRPVVLPGHAVVETYAVLTRLPGDLRLVPADAARLIASRFVEIAPLPNGIARGLHDVLANLDVAGGATYDALVALAARERGVPLATRDARARDTYERVGVEVLIAV